MADVKARIYAEIENISIALAELKKAKDRPNKERLMLAGMGAYLQNVYTGMENILKQLLLHENIPLPDTPTWHKDLLAVAVEHGFITQDTSGKLGKYLTFRHFFTHSYGFLLDEVRVESLTDDIFQVYSAFKQEIDAYLVKIQR
jgi:uncharacterized protein YutE (UPF0331/DUF86 family)